MTLDVSGAQLAAIRAHGERTYPRECCGLLLGSFEKGDKKRLVEAYAVENTWQGAGEFGLGDGQGEERRFLITPEDYRAGERYARERGLEVIGTYHSHPDHPARPSEFDRGNAWPVYSYIIVSVQNGRAADLTSWTLDDERQFQSETICRTTEV
ncbi:Mov34/MPN/PAD-1 family protein [Gloeobacter kilaueensis]|uniref:Mov34/MPN/PAD-1 family protein n=1 Tax=Gloeobacter kilaueensis (strain ATCC BAA-2537 / CCAP 1431/1 / ULC 316 / JS1) TaxID=1183438 RepID=U5QDK2_GLOK1|nr:M67 family metallopeptidase [Gloeobacter kilaueensis]AGY56923.1 Mov34/MPN/PAD-1 family protein [Gloeobacter kilaueensis JS1]